MKKCLWALGALAILGIMLAGCANPVGGTDGGARGVALQASDTKVAVTIPEYRVNPDRSNASGDKITSNGNNDKFPGIYFFWDSKQKEDGILKVEKEYFKHFRCFTLTIKTANEYWDWRVRLQKHQKTTPDGYYTFRIPRSVFDKNINMVFLNSWMDRRATYTKDESDETPVKGVLSFTKVVKDVNGTPMAYELWRDDAAGFIFDIYDGTTLIAGGLTPEAPDGKVTYEGENVVEGKSYTVVERALSDELAHKYHAQDEDLVVSLSQKMQYTIVSGKSFAQNVSEVGDNNIWGDITTQWNNGLAAQSDPALLEKLMGIKDSGNNGAKWIWNTATLDDPTYANLDGEKLEIVSEINLNIPAGATMPTSAPFYYAADNAAFVFVNGKLVGYTKKAFTSTYELDSNISSVEWDTFDPADLVLYEPGSTKIGMWQTVYYADLSSALQHGDNTITIYAANEEGSASAEANPAGVIFAGQFDVTTSGGNSQFVNQEKQWYGGFYVAFQDGSQNMGDLTYIGSSGNGNTIYYAYVKEISNYGDTGDTQKFDLYDNKHNQIVGKVELSVDNNGKLVITVLSGGNAGDSVKAQVVDDPSKFPFNQGSFDYKGALPSGSAPFTVTTSFNLNAYKF